MKGRIEGNDVIISKGDFEHLLNCLANQKWLPKTHNQQGSEIEAQKAIDICWGEGMDILNTKATEAYVLAPEENHSDKLRGCWPKDDETVTQPRPSFKQALTTLINQYSKENDSDTPDFILAKYLTDTLKAFNKATNRREEWYGNDEGEEHDWQFPDNCFRCMEGDQKEYTEQPSAIGQILTEESTLSYPTNIKFTVKYHAE